MTQEHTPQPAPKRPYEIYGFSEQERLYWRVSDERLRQILADDRAIIHTIRESSNTFGEFLFITTSRPGDQGRVAMTFFGLGYHEHRERWLTDEWFWYQANTYPDMLKDQVDKEEAKQWIQQRQESIQPYTGEGTQSEYGQLFELLADLTDDDGALTELQDLGNVTDWLAGNPEGITPPEPEREPPPTGDNLLDPISREKLPPLYSGEELGLDAISPVKFFSPSSNWTWYASEFDGTDLLFGLVIGHEIEIGYFSLAELKSVKCPMGLPIERDLYYDPKTLRELMDLHRQEREGK
ncbi:DUF2958 domain-containing protein [Chloroflexota bacterium]